MTTLTPRGRGAVVLGLLLVAGGLWTSYAGLVGVGVALLVLVALSVVAVLQAPVVAERRVEPRQVPRLSPCGGTLQLRRSRGWLPVDLEAVEMVGDTELIVDVPDEQTAASGDISYPIPTSRRGRLAVGPLRLSRRGPAALAIRTAEVGDRVEVEVLARKLPVRGLPQGVRRGHVGADERAEHGGTDLVGLHEYVPGDDLRRLHWATSARTGTLMVRDDADPSQPHVVVLLDDRAGAYRDADELDEAVDVAASLVAAAGETGHPVHLLTTSGQLDLRADGTIGGRPDLEAAVMHAALTEVQAHGSHGDVPTIAGPIPVRDLDVVAVVTGSASPDDDLLLEAGRASAGVLLAVDPRPTRTSDAVGTVTRLRGPRAEDLLRAWDATVGAGR